MDQTTETATGAALKRSAGDAKAEVKSLASDAKQQARGMFDEKKGALAEQLSGVARAIRNASGELEGERLSGSADSLAGGIDRFAENLKERDLEGAVRDVESFARRQPALFIGGCVAIGFALSRFFKASERQQPLDATASWADDEELGLHSLSHEQVPDTYEETWDEPLGTGPSGVTR